MRIERTIGRKIRDFRKARGLKLEELAHAGGISKTQAIPMEAAPCGAKKPWRC